MPRELVSYRKLAIGVVSSDISQVSVQRLYMVLVRVMI